MDSRGKNKNGRSADRENQEKYSLRGDYFNFLNISKASILKSKIATQTTIAINEIFAKVKELTNTIKQLSDNPSKNKQQSLMQKSGEIISELLDDELQISESETTIELNFAILKFKHTVKKT